MDNTTYATKEPSWLKEVRLKALDRFSHTDWPSPQEEEWRRTDVTEFDFSKYKSDSAPVISMKGDIFQDSAVKEEWLEKGVIVSRLSGLDGTGIGHMKQAFEEGLRVSDNRFQFWHYSQLSHGLYVYIPEFLEIREPLYFDIYEQGDNAVSSPHVIVVLDRGARAKVAVQFHGRNLKAGRGGQGGRGPDKQEFQELIVNTGVDLRIGDAASLEFFQTQDLGVNSLFFNHGKAVVQRDGFLRNFETNLGGKLVKSRMVCTLNGPGSEALLEGIYVAEENQHMDVRSVQNHDAPNANSQAFYKGAVKDSGRTIYQGLIKVSPDAAKTDAYLTNKNLVLNDGARADSIPSLKIETNDVRCSHGSTTGKINEDQIFYLTSRGLSPDIAKRMLILGYFDELLDRMPEKLKEEVGSRIEKRFM